MSGGFARLAEVLAARGIALGAPLVLNAETGSTNDDAKRGARDNAPHGAVWLSESQTNGRGRQGRGWLSAPGENLLFSVLLRPRCLPARVPLLSLVAGLAVRDAVARSLGTSFEDVLVKWPNDVLVRSGVGAARKVAGILVESAILGMEVEYVIVGVGINVHTRAFPEAVAGLATSVTLERERRQLAALLADARTTILADVLEGLARDLPRVVEQGLAPVHARLTEHDALRGCEVESADGGELRGTASGLDLEGRLLVRTATGLVPVSSGELRLRAVT